MNFERTCQAGIVYGNVAGQDLTVDLYLPEAATGGPAPQESLTPEESPTPAGSLTPAVVYIHGGGWVRGSNASPSAVAFALDIASEGIAVACVTYRFAPKHIAPAAIEDCKLAVRWLRSNAAEYGIDPERIVAMGNSAGGHLAAMLGVTGDSDDFIGGGIEDVSSSVMAAVVCCGIADLPGLLTGPEEKEWAEAWIPKNTPDRMKLAKRCSPIAHVSADAAPTLILHGDADPAVPHDQAVAFEKALREAGADAELATIQGAGHFLGITGSVSVQHQIRAARRKFFTKLGLIRETAGVR